MDGTSESRPLVLLAGFDPIFQVGIARALVDGGAAVLDDTQPTPDALVRRAADSGPDAIVLGDAHGSDPHLGARLRAAAPGATLLLWRTGARAVAVLVPGADAPRVVPAPTAAELSDELFGRGGKGETCPSI
jgi:hypothetical protein